MGVLVDDRYPLLVSLSLIVYSLFIRRSTFVPLRCSNAVLRMVESCIAGTYKFLDPKIVLAVREWIIREPSVRYFYGHCVFGLVMSVSRLGVHVRFDTRGGCSWYLGMDKYSPVSSAKCGPFDTHIEPRSFQIKTPIILSVYCILFFSTIQSLALSTTLQ